ncbi:MAG: uracil-DNA glycosylase family protein [Gaiellaceae bacterium]
MIRRLLEASIRSWELDRAVRAYQASELSLGRAAEQAGLTQWELLEAIKEAGVAHPLTAEEAARRLADLTEDGEPTLPDVPPRPGGVLLVGINPAPASVAAGHYYQGRIGQRLWRRLERIGLLENAVPGAEDEAFARAGHGLTDLVKRPTASSAELSDRELGSGVGTLATKIREWKPRLILFAFKEPAKRLLGSAVAPGAGPALAGVPTFLLTGPYAAREEAQRIDAELVALLGLVETHERRGAELSQRVTAKDIQAGRIRFAGPAKRLFPSEPALVETVLRGTRVRGRYNPRAGTGKSAVLGVPRATLEQLVRQNEFLKITRGVGGVVRLD